MSVLSVQAAGRRFADRVLFGDVSFNLAHGDRAGLIGPNGTGKSTLLRTVARLDTADHGPLALAPRTPHGPTLSPHRRSFRSPSMKPALLNSMRS